MLRTRRSHSSLSTTVKYWRIPVDIVCERTSERALVRVEPRYASLNARGKNRRDHITVIILFYLMCITCAAIIASRRGLESTAECWTVWTGRRKVSGGRSVDSSGRARPLPTSVGRTPWHVVLSMFPTQRMSVEARHLHVRAQEVLLRMLYISSSEASRIIEQLSDHTPEGTILMCQHLDSLQPLEDKCVSALECVHST